MINTKRSKLNNVIVALATITVISFTPDNNGSAAEVSETHIIEIRDLKFIPNKISVKSEDVVQWINHDFIPHTATANNKKWNSELISAESKWQMTIRKDTFKNYFCIYHPGMKGKIEILE
jgi:plastocyanin